MKKFLIVFAISLLAITIFADYLTSFSAAIQNWENSNIDQALSLVSLSLSSTLNIAYAPDLWYFKSRLELMEGKIKQAKSSLEMAASVFHPKDVYFLLNSLASASVTSFSPIANVNYVNSIKGFYGGEIFYSPISALMRYNSYYVLDAANDFVEEFGQRQRRYLLSMHSTPTAMIYSNKLDVFFISYENGSVYEYSPDFSKQKLFADGLSYPTVSFADNAGRVYVVNCGKDSIEVFECDGEKFRTFNFFKKRVHILGNVRESNGIMYVMDFTDRSVRRFNLFNGTELPSIPFPKDHIPTSFEIFGRSVLFVDSHNLSVGGINFPLTNSKSVFSSSLTQRLLITCDVEKNEINLYDVESHSDLFIPIMDNLSFADGKVKISFRILNPFGLDVENPQKIIVNDNGFTKSIELSRRKIRTIFHLFPSLEEIFKMNKNHKNVIVLKSSALIGHEREMFSSLILNNTSLYLVEDTSPTRLENELVKMTGGDFITMKEAEKFQDLVSRFSSFEFEASYKIGLPEGVDEIDMRYGAKGEFVDSLYYTLQNVMK